MAKKQKTRLLAADVDTFEIISPLMAKLYADVQELAKKKPDGILSRTRTDMINRLLDSARILLKEEQSINFLDMIDFDSVPQNADAMLILGQYLSALTAYKDKYTDGEAWDKYWLVSDSNQQRKV